MTEGWEVEFGNEDVKQADHWLRTELSDSFTEFNQKFGHHCLREFDPYYDTLGTKCAPVILSLQSILKTSYSQCNSSKDLTIVANLPFGKPQSLKFLLPLSNSCVANREESKSMLIRTVGQFRNAYRKLGNILVGTGALPDKDLVFFLTHYELQQLIFDDHSSLVMKSVRRRKLYSKWDKLMFPEMVFGYPSSQQVADNLHKLSGHEVRGTPACPDRVTGTERVVLHIS